MITKKITVVLENGIIVSDLQIIFKAFIGDYFYEKKEEYNQIKRYLEEIPIIEISQLPKLEEYEDNGYGYGSCIFGGKTWRVNSTTHMYPRKDTTIVFLASEKLKSALIENMKMFLS